MAIKAVYIIVHKLNLEFLELSHPAFFLDVAVYIEVADARKAALLNLVLA